MAQLNIRIDDETRDLFDNLASARGMNTSDLLRELINQSLGRDEEGFGDMPTPQSLSVLQRHELALQHKILSKLSDDDDEYNSEYHDEMVEILSSGFTSQYYKLFESYYSEMTNRQSALTNDIMEMFTTIKWSLEELGAEDKELLGGSTRMLEFRGFDLNSAAESKLWSYAKFLVEHDRWVHMKPYFDPENESGNSHAPLLATYQRMLSVWKPLHERKMQNFHGGKGMHYSIDELKQILAAWPYPSN